LAGTGLSSLGAGMELVMANLKDPQDTRTGFNSPFGSAGAVGTGRAEVLDQGLRRHMLSIYNIMASGVLLTGIIALLFVQSPMFASVFQAVQTPEGVFLRPTGLGWVISLAPLAYALAWMFAGRLSTATLHAMFWSYAVVLGLSLSVLLVVYTGASVAATFFATAGAFAGLSLFGYTTKRDLSGWGSFLIMGAWGIFISLMLNAFVFHSSGFDLVISFIGVLIFAGLTAYDTQYLKHQYYAMPAEYAGRARIVGATKLYLDFINMFLFLLRFMGASRN
jgi:FtsH-binding integral membrane protein